MDANAPTQLHQDFIRASRRAAIMRQRGIVGVAIVVALVALGLAGWAEINRREAQSQRVRAETALKEAQAQRERAEPDTRARHQDRKRARLRSRPEVPRRFRRSRSRPSSPFLIAHASSKSNCCLQEN